jgi:hypothetical protein
MANETEIKDELVDATQDLRETLHEINHRVEQRVARLRPDRRIKKHPMTTAAVAGALGFALGSDSGEAAMLALLAVGAVFLFSRESTNGKSSGSESANEIQRI